MQRKFKFYGLSLILPFFALINSLSAQTKAENYIENYKGLAVNIMNKEGIPASVLLGIAMHESANGQSKIAVNLNNHFGLKGYTPNKKIRSAYKGFESVEDGYADVIRMLKTRKNFSYLFDKYPGYNAKGWIKGIQKGGYAASKVWASQVIAIITKYNLSLLDVVPPPAFLKPDKSENTNPADQETAFYKVKRGDTLSAIAKKHGITVKQLQLKNKLTTTRLKIGQVINI